MTDEQFDLIRKKGREDFKKYHMDLMSEQEIFYWSERVMLEAAYEAGFDRCAELEFKSERA